MSSNSFYWAVSGESLLWYLEFNVIGELDCEVNTRHLLEVGTVGPNSNANVLELGIQQILPVFSGWHAITHQELDDHITSR